MLFARKVWKLLVAVKDGLVLLLMLLFFLMLYAALTRTAQCRLRPRRRAAAEAGRRGGGGTDGPRSDRATAVERDADGRIPRPVSYTHLTLPTNREV